MVGRKPTLARFLYGDIGLKLTALVLALLVYFSVFLEQEHESVVSVPLVVENSDPDRMLVSEYPETIKVKVVAPGRLIARWWLTRAGGSLTAAIPAPDGVMAINRSLLPEDVLVPLDVELRVVEVVEPRSIQLTFDRVMERRVPVQATRTGRQPQGFMVSGPMSVDPESVLVRGPREVVMELVEVSTIPLDFNGRSRPIHEKIGLVHAESLAFDPAEVTVSADVERTRQLVIEGIPVVVSNARGYRVELEPTVGAVTLMGPKSRLDMVEKLNQNGDPTGVTIELDAAGLGPGTHPRAARVDLTEALRLIAVSPPEFTLTLHADRIESP
jgi:YbbR domain-containing protein